MQAVVPRLESGLAFRTMAGKHIRATLLHLTRDAVVFEVYGPTCELSQQDQLHDVTIFQGTRRTHSGDATVSGVITAGPIRIVTATPVDTWVETTQFAASDRAQNGVSQLLEDWDACHSLLPEYQLAVTSLRGFLAEMSRRLAAMDLSADTSVPPCSEEAARERAEQLYETVRPRLSEMFQRLETATQALRPDQKASHWAFARQELHPLVLCAPFCHRAFVKPLGYAGDYESVNMILRNQMEGSTTFARIINAYFLRIDVSEAHRNRIQKLADTLKEEARRVARTGRRLRVLSLGCGPAEEVFRFVRDSELSEECEITLLDFNEETIEQTRRRIAGLSAAIGRRIELRVVNRSVTDLLKEAAGRDRGEPRPEYDLIYCAGLFDYLSDRVCSRLHALMCDWAAPGGLVFATNVHPRHTSHAILDDLADWHLILRNEVESLALVPPGRGTASVGTDATGVNVLLEVRKTDVLNESRTRTERNQTAFRSVSGV